MAIVTKTRTYNTGDILPAGYYNADRDEIIAGVNSIDNAQISPTAGILESKIAFNTGGGHHHDGVDSRLITLTWAQLDFSGLTANYPAFINAGANGFQTHLIGNADIDAAAAIVYSKLNLVGSILATDLNVGFLLPEAQVTFDPVAGHIHDGVFSASIPVGNLNVTGLTPLQFLRVNAGGTALETAPVTTIMTRVYGFYSPDSFFVADNISWNPTVIANSTVTKLSIYAKVAPTGANAIFQVALAEAPGTLIATITLLAGSKIATTTTIASSALTAGQILKLSCSQGGSIVAGSGVSAVLECTEP